MAGWIKLPVTDRERLIRKVFPEYAEPLIGSAEPLLEYAVRVGYKKFEMFARGRIEKNEAPFEPMLILAIMQLREHMQKQAFDLIMAAEKMREAQPKLDAQFAKEYIKLGWELFDTDLDMGMRWVKRAYDVNPNEKHYVQYMARAYAQKKEFTLALKWTGDFIKLAPKDPEGYQQNAKIYAEMGRDNDAIDWLTRLKDAKGDYIDNLYWTASSDKRFARIRTLPEFRALLDR